MIYSVPYELFVEKCRNLCVYSPSIYKYCLGNFCGSTLYTLGAAQHHVQNSINYLERIRVVIMSHGTTCCHKQTGVDPVTFSCHSQVFCEVICPIRCIFLLMVSLNFPLSPFFFSESSWERC